jgi:hypothetical protein
MTNVKAGQLSSRVQGALPARYAGNANPVGEGVDTRAAALYTADPRMQNPKLNVASWSSAYAVNRTAEQPKGTKKKRKTLNMRKGGTKA